MRTRTADDLRRLRERAGLSQTMAAKISHTPLRTWQSWEANKTVASAARPPGMAFVFLAMYILANDYSLVKIDLDKLKEVIYNETGPKM